MLFQKGAAIEDFWPFAALSVAIGVCGAMSLLQHATFAGTVKNIHMLNGIQPKEFHVPEAFTFKTDRPLTAKEKHPFASDPDLLDQFERLRKHSQPSIPLPVPPKIPEIPKVAPESSEDSARELEIAITGSLGFWTTVGLLACWKIVETSEQG